MKFIEVHVNWKRLRAIECAFRGHQWDQFYPISPFHSADWFCRRCDLTRKRVVTRYTDDGGWRDLLDADGNVESTEQIAWKTNG